MLDKNSIMYCPICKEELYKESENKIYKCKNNHSYDIAKQGYVNLLISNQKNSKNPGDSKEMVLARIDFLSRGFYKKISEEISRVIGKYLNEKGTESNINILDVGCGEGYYLSNLKESLKDNNTDISYYGIDVSKEAVKYAARNDKECIFSVGTNYHLPIKNESCDIVFSVFSPIDIDEVDRVLKHDGIFLRVLPRVNHLIELRDIIYDDVKIKDKVYKVDENKGKYIDEVNITYKMDLNSEEIDSLLKMTPHYWKSNKENKEKLLKYNELSITVDMRIGVFSKKDKTEKE